MDLSIPAEWSIFVHRFKQAKNEKEKTDLLAGNTVDQIIDFVFKILRNERDEQLKITVLIFLEDNVELFFSDKQRMEKTCTILNNLIHLPNDSPIPISDHVKSQVVITLTTILITLDTIKSQPRAFESFVEVLFEVIAKVNEPNDKLLRQTACESLKELEQQYPGLLVAKIGNLFVLAQQERSHVHQSYHLLAVTVLRSLIQVVEDISANSTKDSAASMNELATFLSQLLGLSANSFASFSLFTSRTELNPFSLSAIVRYNAFERQIIELPCQPKQLLLEPLHSEVKKAIQYFVEISTIVSPWAMVELSYSIIYLIQLTDLSRDLFKHQLSRLGMSFNSLLKHVMLIYSAVFYDIFQSQFEQFIVSLIHHVNNTINPTAERVLALEWLTYYPYQSVLHLSHHDYLFPNHQSFLPTIFDVLQVREAKIEILRHCFKPKDSNTHIIKNILNLFVCFQEFIYHKKDDYLVLMVFRLVRDYLATFPNELFDQSYKYLSQAIERNPSFVGRVIKLMQSLEQTPLHHKLLQYFEREITSLPIARVGNYLDLVHRINLDTEISPVNLLKTLHSFLRYTSTLKTGDWATGNTLLEICKAVLVTHVNVSIFEPLHALLMFVAVFYSDVDVRDRAHFYDQLLIHLSNDKIKSLLTASAANDLQEAGVDNLHRVRETNELSTKNFIMLHRLTPQHNHNCTMYLDNVSNEQSQTNTINEDTRSAIIRAYKSVVAHQASHVTVDLPFIVTYKPRLDKDTPRTIYSVTITFNDSPLYHAIEPLHLPILVSEESRDLEQEQFPYKYRVMVNLRPVLPIPASFDTKITFNIAGGINCEDTIDALTVSFTDLLLPVTFDSDTCTPSTVRQVLFEQLWSERETSSDTRGAISVKHINKNSEHVLSRLANKFKPYLIDPNASLTDIVAPTQVLGFIFLPPKYHLLLKFNVKPTHTLIELTTDYWFNLTFVDQYLDDMFAN